MTDPTASFSLLPSFNSASIGTSTTGPATSYSASDTVSYSEMPPLSKPSGQAYQLEGQLQLEESVQASKPPQTSAVSCEHNFINMMYKHCDIFFRFSSNSKQYSEGYACQYKRNHCSECF